MLGWATSPGDASAAPWIERVAPQARQYTLTLATYRLSGSAPRLHTAPALGDAFLQPRAYVLHWRLIPYVVAPPPPTPPLPTVTPAFRNGTAAAPSCLAVQGILTAIHHAYPRASGWTQSCDGRPSFTFAKRAGTIVTVVTPPQGDPPWGEALASLWQTTKELTDLDGDVLLAALCQAIASSPDATQEATWLTADAVLDYRGIRPKAHQYGPLRYRAGHRAQDRAQIATSMERLNRLSVQLHQVEILEPRSHEKPRRAYYTHESKVLVIEDRLLRDGQPIAWRYVPGPWLAPFLASPNRQVAVLMQQTLRYDPYRQRWEKRLSRYLTFHLRMDARNGRPLVRRIGPLLDELHLPVDRRHPERTRLRFETALQRLAEDGVIGAWDYTSEAHDTLARLPSRGWLKRWQDMTIAVTATRAVQERYSSIRSGLTRQTGA